MKGDVFMRNTLRWLVISSILYLVSAGIGTIIAFQQNLTANFGGFLNGQDILKDFLTTNGTALSAPLPFLILQLLFTLLALRMGWQDWGDWPDHPGSYLHFRPIG